MPFVSRLEKEGKHECTPLCKARCAILTKNRNIRINNLKAFRPLEVLSKQHFMENAVTHAVELRCRKKIQSQPSLAVPNA